MELIEIENNKIKLIRFYIWQGVNMMYVYIRLNNDIFKIEIRKRGSKNNNCICCCYETNRYYRNNNLIKFENNVLNIKVVNTTNNIQDCLCQQMLIGVAYQLIRFPLNNCFICVWEDNCCMRCCNNVFCDTYTNLTINLDKIKHKIGDVESVSKTYSKVYKDNDFKKFIENIEININKNEMNNIISC